MKHILMVMMLTLAIFGKIASSHAAPCQNGVNINGDCSPISAGMTVPEMNAGTVDIMQNGTITRMQGGNIATMNGGNIATMNNGSVDFMYDGTITTMNNGTITNMYDGTITRMQGGNIATMNGGNIATMNNGSVDFMYDGTITTMNNGTITNMYDGTITRMQGGTINTMNDGTITNMNNGTITRMQGGTITTMNNGTITNMYDGTITRMQGGTINTMNDGTITNMNNGTITRMQGGTITTMNNGSVDFMYDGTITTMNNGSVDFMYDGTITTMNNGTITNMYDGTITRMQGGNIATMNGGNIATMNNGSVDFMYDGTITTMNNGTITNMYDGTITRMQGGTINTMNDGTITNMNNGTITRMQGGTITTMNNGTINTMNGGTITTMNNGTITNMYDGTITTMNNGRVDFMYDGTINNINGGTIGNVGSGATLGDIKNVTLTGNIDPSNTSINLLEHGTMVLAPNSNSIDLKSNILAGNGATIILSDKNSGSYVSAPNHDITFENNGTMVVASSNNNESFQNINYNGTGGKFTFANNNSTPYKARIVNFNASNSVLFTFNVNQAGEANYLEIIEATPTSEKNHKVAILSQASIYGGAPAQKIDIIKDRSPVNHLNFTLSTGKYVAVGAYNYSLDNDGSGEWSLNKTNTLSDAAKSIGASGSATVSSARIIQNAVHKRLGDIRSFQNGEGLGSWARAYGNDMNFKNLQRTDISSKGMEAGVDKEVHKFENGRIILGSSLGILYSDQDVKSSNTIGKNGADAMTPYIGLYATTLFNNGLYIDTIARYANESTDGYHYGGGIKNNYKTKQHIGIISAEVGYQHFVNCAFVIEPRAEVSYGRIGSDTFRDGSGFEGKIKNTDSLQLDTGVLLRYKRYPIKPYARLGVIYEFDGKTNVNYAGHDYASRIDGARLDTALGVTGAVNMKFKPFGEIGYQTGEHSFRNISANVGMTYEF